MYSEDLFMDLFLIHQGMLLKKIFKNAYLCNNLYTFNNLFTS